MLTVLISLLGLCFAQSFAQMEDIGAGSYPDDDRESVDDQDLSGDDMDTRSAKKVRPNQ